MPNIDEKRELVERNAERYFDRYRQYVEAVESSPLAKTTTIGTSEIYALGKMLEQYEEFQGMCEADGSVADLGALPRIALDVITVNYGQSPMAMVASIQPVDEELGIIHYKDVVAKSTAGNFIDGDVMVSAEGGIQNSFEGYSTTAIESESLGSTVGAQTNYSGNLAITPIKPETVVLNIATPTPIDAKDDGKGNILGVGVQGTIDYATGAYVLDLIAAPAGGEAIIVSYHQNIESAAGLKQISYELKAKSIQARVFALESSIGMLKSYSLRKRYGTVAEDELVMDLTNSINSEVFGTLVKKMAANAQGLTQWSKTPPSGVSYFEHRKHLLN